MRITTTAALAGMVMVAAPLAAQTQGNAKVMQAMALQPGTKYVPPLCELKGGDFRTNGAGVSLKTASEGGFSSATDGRTSVDAKKYVDLLNHAKSVAGEAIAANPQNAAGWYYLGRAELMLGNLIGADTAFTKLEALSPPCAAEIKGLRQKAWLVLVNPSTAYLQNKQYDSALAVLREANIIARYYPQGYYNLGATFANMAPSQPDSAIFYFKLAADKAAADPSTAAMYQGSLQNIAYMYLQMNDNANAAAYFKKYLALNPTDADASRRLEAALRASGGTAEADKLENARMASGTLSGAELSRNGVRKFNDKDYAGAADAFKMILVSDPYNHDALSNLANSYYAMNDAKNLVESAKSILAIDPLGKNNLKLLANGYRLLADTTKWLDVVTQLQAMTYEVNVTSFTIGKDTVKFVGVATGDEGRDANDKVIPPAPSTLVFEFMDSKGAVVATQDVAVPALAADAKSDISVTATGAGVIAWKYHKK